MGYPDNKVCVMNGWLDGRTEKPKAICPLNCFKVGGNLGEILPITYSTMKATHEE